MADKTFIEVYLGDFAANWERAATRAQAGDRRGRGLCARRRLRARHDVRLHHRRRQRQIRPARNQARRHARHRRHAAPHPRRRQGQSHGHLPHRPHDGRRRGRARGPRGARRAAGQAARRSDEGRRNDRLDVAAVGDGRQGSGQPRVRDRRSPKACASSAGCSTRCSPPTIRRKAWPPSSTSGRRTSKTNRIVIPAPPNAAVRRI